MMATRGTIAEAQLQALYETQRLSITQIAHHLGVAPTTISRRFKDLSIRARPRGPVPGGHSTNSPIEWTAALAYAVGVIATDGNLSKKRDGLSVVSNDIDLLETVRACLNVTAPIRRHIGGYGQRCHRLAWGDGRLYEWLLTVGLTPAKSLTLGPLTIPAEYFADFFRGCIDGDGSILTYVDDYHAPKKPTYVYTRLYVSLVSASRRFVDWLQLTVRERTGLAGSLRVKRSRGRNDIWCLRYAKRESLALLLWMYYAPDVPCLRRKRDIAIPFLTRREPPRHRRPGRPMV